MASCDGFLVIIPLSTCTFWIGSNMTRQIRTWQWHLIFFILSIFTARFGHAFWWFVWHGFGGGNEADDMTTSAAYY
jgi:hypothetical protein